MSRSLANYYYIYTCMHAASCRFVVMSFCCLACRDKLSEFMESKGANSPGILALTSGLSKVCMHAHVHTQAYICLDLHGHDMHGW